MRVEVRTTLRARGRIAGGLAFAAGTLAASMLLSAPEARAQEALQRTTLIEDGHQLGVGRLVRDLDLLALGTGAGAATPATRRLSQILEGRSLVVIAMTSVTCPLSKKYAPRLAAMEDELRQRGVGFVYVNTVEAESESDMRRQAREQGWEGPYLADRDRSVSGGLGARTTTEVFLIDASRTLLYRGALDDQYGVGTSLPEARRHFLRDAIEAGLAGERVRVRATWPPGCLLDEAKDAPKAPANAAPEPLTYHGRVSRILAQSCVECHQNGGEAPFSLESLADVQGRIRMIEAVVGDRIMPPSHGQPSPSAPALDNASGGARWMNDEDRSDLLEWLASARPVGEPGDAVRARVEAPSGSWRIGPPEVVLFGAPMALPAVGPLVHRRVLIPTNSEADLWLSSVEVRPVERGTVHHALLWIVPPGGRLPGPGEVPTDLELFATYSPGDSVVRLAPGRGRRVPAGSLLVADAYLRPMGREMNAGLRIGMRTLVAAPTTPRTAQTLVASLPEIAPGARDVRASAEMVLDRTTRVAALTPSASARCVSLRVEAMLPDGSTRVLLDAPKHDFRWQIRSDFAEPVELPAGTRVRLTGVFDNSASAPNNPAPSEAARGGAGAAEERLLVSIESE